MDTDLKRMNELLVLIDHHDKKYHDEDNPEILDPEYDDLVRELRVLEKKYPDKVTASSPTKRIGYASIGLFDKVEHRSPMYSLNNVFNEEELMKFVNRVKSGLKDNPTTSGKDYSMDSSLFINELKYDGLSIDLRYWRDNGVMALVHAITRGDGTAGEDVYSNVVEVAGVPYNLPLAAEGVNCIEVRGEIVMPFESFIEYNEQLALEGKEEKVNPRNAAAGGVRNSDPEVVKKMGLRFIAYQLVDDKVPTHKTSMNLLEEWGFDTGAQFRKECADPFEMMGYVHWIQELRSKIPFPIDGVVFKVNNKSAQSILGYHSRAPRFATAYKFPAEEARTTVELIEFQVGMTGAITPVARITPVFVGGVTVTNVTLHNENEIRRKDIRIGDEVIVCRAGDVIPAILRVEKGAREHRLTREFVMPTHCKCGTLLHKEPKEAVWRCTAGRKCPDQLVGYFINAYSRDALNIQGLGDVTIKEMVSKLLIQSLGGVYTLKDIDLYLLDETEKATVDSLRAAIESSRYTTMERVLLALGIRHVGKGTAKRLAAHYGTIDRLLEERDVEGDGGLVNLMKIEDIGPTTAKSIYAYLTDRDNVNEMMYLVDKLYIAENIVEYSLGPKDLVGQTFVITGSFVGLTREEVAKIITDRGGNVSTSVSGKTTCLLSGEEPGASKVAKALKLGIRISETIP